MQDNIHLWKLDESDGLTTWVVNGFYVRSNVDSDFTEGGNDAAYPDFIPENEIWIDSETSVREWKYILLHEKTERQLMKDERLDYATAHDKANQVELAERAKDYPDTEPAQAQAGTHENDGGKSMNVKVGARNNSEDQKRMQQIHDLAVMNGAMCDQAEEDSEEHKSMDMSQMSEDDMRAMLKKKMKDPDMAEMMKDHDPDEMSKAEMLAMLKRMDEEKSIDLVYVGDAVKSLSDAGEIGGYLVRWGSSQEKDLEGDYFTKNTYFGSRDGDGADTFMNHCIPLAKGLEEFADWIGKPIKTSRDAVGLFAKTVLNLSDEYEKIIFDLVKQGKLKWSSGTASHLVKRMKDGQIKRWPIVDASLTPIPAEWRESNKVYPIKSYREMFDKWSADGLVALAEATALEAAREIPDDLKREAEVLKMRAGAS